MTTKVTAKSGVTEDASPFPAQGPNLTGHYRKSWEWEGGVWERGWGGGKMHNDA